MKLFDPYVGATKEVAGKDVYHEIFDKHCRLPENSSKNDEMEMAYHVWRYLSRDMTSCIRPSFVSWMRHLLPYYTRSELRNLAKNYKLSELRCEDTDKYEFSLKDLCEHFQYIVNNHCESFIRTYSLLDAVYVNKVLRGVRPGGWMISQKILRLYDLIKNSPSLKDTRTVFRFVDDDSYIHEGYVIDSFWSCTRNPFYNPKKHPFGYIVFAIEVPSDVRGVALCIEGFSLFPEEQEVILPPGLKLSIVDIQESSSGYWHYDKHAERRIVRLVRLKIISSEEMNFENTYKPATSIGLNDCWAGKTSNTLNSQSDIYWGICRTFETLGAKCDSGFPTIKVEGLTGLIFPLRYDSTNKYYERFFKNKTNEGVAIVQWEPHSGEILSFIEISLNEFHVDYIRRFLPIQRRNDEQLVKLLSLTSYWLGSTSAVIYAHYIPCGVAGTQAMNTDIVSFTKNRHLRFKDVPEITLQLKFGTIRDLSRPLQRSKLPYSMVSDVEKLQTSIHSVIDFYVYACSSRPELADKLIEIYEIDTRLTFIMDTQSYLIRMNSLF